MNITLQRTPGMQRQYAFPVLLLARKLQAAATGHFTKTWPLAIYLAQAQALADSSELAHSVAASLEELLNEAV